MLGGQECFGTYTFEEFKKNSGYIRQLKQSSREKCVVDESDFMETDKTFADIFPNMKKHKLYYIDDEAYKISEIEDNAQNEENHPPKQSQK
jgi:hypothetical protein